MEAPVLVTTDWSTTFILQKDASAYGLGYFLSQLNSQGEEHPIAFASRKLLPSERNYSTIEREALAMVKGVKHFRTYLEGNRFTIHTDHNPLTHLSNLKDSHGRLARWALFLQPYSFSVVHWSVRANANGFSRDTRATAKVEGISDPLPPVTLPQNKEVNSLMNEEVNGEANGENVVSGLTTGSQDLNKNSLDKQSYVQDLLINKHTYSPENKNSTRL